MKLIAFSLWGTDPKYTIGAIKNAELAQEIYPDWVCRYYIDLTVPVSVISELEKFENVQIVQKNTFGDWRGMFWRFEPASESDVDILISRDTDSRLSYREKAAVDEWLASDKGFHIMRDHPYHKFPILGGMWGCKKDTIPNMKSLIDNWDQEDKYGTDYEFFANCVIPSISNNTLVHDEFFGGMPFPTERKNFEFVGQVYDEKENTVLEHIDVLKRAIERELYVHHHLGLGDHIDCNALTRIVSKNIYFNKIKIFAKQKYSKMVEFMYRDEPKINVVAIPGINEYKEIDDYISHRPYDPRYMRDDQVGQVLRVGHENYPWGQEEKLGMGCAEIFYKLVGIDFQKRFDEFYFERDLKEENRVYLKLNPDNEDYVFVHDDPKRGFEIGDEKIIDFYGKKIKIIRNDITENIFYFCKILENAKQIHCMESSFRSLIETLNINGELFFHNFREGASGYLGNSTQQNWKEVKW